MSLKLKLQVFLAAAVLLVVAGVAYTTMSPSLRCDDCRIIKVSATSTGEFHISYSVTGTNQSTHEDGDWSRDFLRTVTVQKGEVVTIFLTATSLPREPVHFRRSVGCLISEGGKTLGLPMQIITYPNDAPVPATCRYTTTGT